MRRSNAVLHLGDVEVTVRENYDMRRPVSLRLVKQDRWVANGRAFQPRWPCGFRGELYSLRVLSILFYTVVNLHDLWSNYPRSTCHIIDLAYEKWVATWGQAQILGA